jgi:hypothetical protein
VGASLNYDDNGSVDEEDSIDDEDNEDGDYNDNDDDEEEAAAVRNHINYNNISARFTPL